jgi:hypothetical protein
MRNLSGYKNKNFMVFVSPYYTALLIVNLKTVLLLADPDLAFFLRMNGQQESSMGLHCWHDLDQGRHAFANASQLGD